MSIEFENGQASDQQSEQQPIRKSMFQILQDYDNLMQEVEMEEGEVTDIVAEQLLINEDELETKLKSYKEFMRMLKSKITFNKEDRKKSTARDKAITNRIKYMNTFIVEALNRFGGVSKTGTRNYKGNDFSVYVKDTLKVDLNDANIGSSYTSTAYTFVIPTNQIDTKINKLVRELSIVANGVEKEIIVDKTALKNDLKLGMYKCGNINCKAHASSAIEDCSCNKIPTLIKTSTPIFK